MTCKKCKDMDGTRVIALITDGISQVKSVVMATCSHTSDEEWEEIKPRSNRSMGALASDPVALPTGSFTKSGKSIPNWMTVHEGGKGPKPQWLKDIENPS